MGVEPLSSGKVGTATRRECLDNAGPVRRSAVPRTEELEQNVGLGHEVRRRTGLKTTSHSGFARPWLIENMIEIPRASGRNTDSTPRPPNLVEQTAVWVLPSSFACWTQRSIVSKRHANPSGLRVDLRPGYSNHRQPHHTQHGWAAWQPAEPVRPSMKEAKRMPTSFSPHRDRGAALNCQPQSGRAKVLARIYAPLAGLDFSSRRQYSLESFL